MYRRIVFLGMPCSGKTSIGKAVAKQLNCPFLDMDEVIEKRMKMTIPQIFERYGEDTFRQLEKILAQKLGKTKGVVISTGGGIVLRSESIEPLVKNSFVIFLHRDFLKLANTPRQIMDKRPLLREKSIDEFFDMYQKRLPLYRKYCTVEVSNDRQREDAVEHILDILDDSGINIKK